LHNLSLSPVLGDNVFHGVDHVLYVVLAHPWEQGQGDHALVFPIGHREVIGFVAILIPVVRVEVDGDEVDAGADVAGLEFFNLPSSITAAAQP